MRLTDPATGAAYDLDTDDGRAALRDAYAPADGIRGRLNMITALTGAAAGSDGTSETLSSPTDRAVLRAIRSHADAVIVGAASVRVEGYVVPRTARLVVLTTTGDLSGHRLGGDASRILLVCPIPAVPAVRANTGLDDVEVVGAGGGSRLDAREVVAALADRGIARWVCEGGPAVASLFAGAGLIDEYCLTVTPILAPAPRPFVTVAVPVETEVAGMLVDEASFSYLRLRPRRPDPARAATP